MITNSESGFGSIAGQEKPIRLLRLFLKYRSIPHALLFTGIAGIGKRTTAKALAMACNCLKAEFGKMQENHGRGGDLIESCGACRSCRKILSGSHPDVIAIEPQGQFIKIGQIRELLKVFSLKPNEAYLRVAMIQEAHAMNPEASNALLKLLEEPPDRTLLILITHQASDLLPTIVSRCQAVGFRPLETETIKTLLIKKEKVPAQSADALASFALGSYTKAVAMKEGNWKNRKTWLTGFLSELSSKSIAEILAFSEKMTEEKAHVSENLEILKTWVRDLAVYRVDPGMVIQKDLITKIKYVSERLSVERLLKIETLIEKTERNLRSNANPRLLVENIMLEMIS